MAHAVGDYYKEEVKIDLNMRCTMKEFKQGITKMKTNNSTNTVCALCERSWRTYLEVMKEILILILILILRDGFQYLFYINTWS